MSLPAEIVELLSTNRPDTRTWVALCKVLAEAAPDAVDLVAVKKALSSWPKEVPRPAPKEWQATAGAASMQFTNSLAHRQRLRSLCLDVAENEQLYHHYITEVAKSSRLQLRDGSPAVTLWRQPRGELRLQNGTIMTLGGGQPGLADLGGVMTVEYEKSLHCVTLPPLADRRSYTFVGDQAIITLDRAPVFRLNLYVEAEIKIDGKLPPLAQEYRGTSMRQLTPTEQDQVRRQQTQLARGGCYIFAERVEELVDGFITFRDAVVTRLS